MSKYSPQQLFGPVAALLHLVTGFVWVLLPIYLFGTGVDVCLGILGSFFAYDILKEFVWDLRNERGATVLGGLADMGEYLIGVGAAGLIAWAKLSGLVGHL